MRSKRKAEHLALAINTADGPGSSGFEDIYLLQDSVPDLALEEIDLSIDFLGKTIGYPLLINALTGGTDQSKNINRILAFMASKFGLAMAVGSMTIAMEDPALRDSFTIVREMNPEGIILANLGANSSSHQACEAVKMIGADGLQLHFNVPQELAMSEGDRNFRGIIDNVSRIVDACPVPVIAKEVGFGFSQETVAKLYTAGVRIFDNGGQGGTNFLAIEDQRQGMFDHQLDDWGIPTAASLAEIVAMQLPVQIVASGGIRTATEIAKAIAMGADMVGITGLFLKILLHEGQDELDRRIESLLYQLQAVFLMSGARDCSMIRTKPVLILGKTAEWLRARNIDPGIWANK
ncbi:MAG: type 2 isopentenyl-diphosphate Delta-isomerase [Syntrophomonadaceae bacterium]|nr:type 2 isopentenyl-diphosphate Delta-isomerase [Syntrophomonadaceae bacterium]